MDFRLTEEQELFQKELRRFAEEKLVPLAPQVDDSEDVPWEVHRLLRERDLFRAVIPEEYGGLGISSVRLCIVREELNRVCTAADLFFTMQGLTANPVAMFGDEEQKSKYLPGLGSGERLGAFCLTEPNAGSDVASLEMTARLDGDRYILNGTKVYVSKPEVTDIFVVFAKTDPSRGGRGISAFILEKDFPGVSTDRIHLLLKEPIGHLYLSDCPVPKENLMGEPGRGMSIALGNLNVYRVTVGAAAVGMAQACFEAAVRYAKARIQFGRPLADNQAIQFKLADMATELDAARLMVYRAAWLRDQGVESVIKEASMAKLFATEVAQRVSDEAIQIHGGVGLARETRVQFLYRAIRETRIYEGTSEIQRIVIARHVLRD